MGDSHGELSLQRALLERSACDIPGLRLFRRNIGFATTASGNAFKAGIKGQADLYGYYTPTDGRTTIAIAVPIELELKSASGRQTEPQKLWAAFCVARRIPYLLLRAELRETPEETVTRWLFEIRTLLTSLLTSLPTTPRPIPPVSP